MKEYYTSVACPACGAVFSILGQTAEQVRIKCPKCPALFLRNECGCVFYQGTAKAACRLCPSHSQPTESARQ